MQTAGGKILRVQIMWELSSIFAFFQFVETPSLKAEGVSVLMKCLCKDKNSS